jgi:putative ABC transport system substrate-binding protein
MANLGYKEGENVKFIWKSIEGDVNLAPQVASSLLDKGPSVIVSITTPVSQAVYKQAKGKVPIVFCGVTDPISAGLVKSWGNEKGSGITGTSDRWPYAEQLDLIKELIPSAQKVGFPYNSGESNSQYAITVLEPLAKERNLELIKAEAPNIGAVRAAVDGLVNRKVDVIYVSSDNTVMAGFESILKVAYERKIPVIVGESANVERGGLASYSVNYKDLGIATADLVDKVLRGTEPGTLPIVTFKGEELVINLEAAQKMGVHIPEKIKSRAIIVGTK